MQFRTFSPLAKLSVWAGMIVAILASLQAVCWMLGIAADVLEDGTCVLVATLASLMLLMSWDRRPISDFGFIVGPTWKRLWAQGIGAGLATYGFYVAVALLCGAYALDFDSVSPGRACLALGTGLTAIPLAATQQVIFSGYLLAMLRDRYSRAVSVAACSAIFAVVHKLDDLPALADPMTWQLLAGLFLVAALLCTLRMLTGSVLIPAGLLSGWIFLRRFTGELRLLQTQPDSPFTWWLVPRGDTRQAPLMIAALAVGLFVCWLVLRRRGEASPPLTDDALHADFKRVFPLSHAAALAPLDVWIPRLVTARFRVGLDYVPRLLFVLLLSTFNTILSLPERLVLPWLLRRRKVPDPVFVVGVHRSGTTHLQNLLALDRQFCTTRTYHMMNPAGCVFSGWALVPLLAAFLPWKRPMDAVRFGIFTAEEEEQALAGFCSMTPYWAMTFPAMWPHYERFFFTEQLPADERRRWQAAYYRVLQKITFWSSKRPMLKNPCNTGRVATLRRMFPGAKFIHISRHPYDVILSNRRLARTGHVVNQLQDSEPERHYETRYLDYYHDMESACRSAAEAMAQGEFAHLRYEDLTADPKGVIRRVYDQLGLEFSPEYERRLDEYLNRIAGYCKNVHRPLTEDEKQRIDQRMALFLAEWGYAEPPQTTPSRAA